MKTDDPLILLHDEDFLIYWLCNLESEADDLFAFPVLKMLMLKDN